MKIKNILKTNYVHVSAFLFIAVLSASLFGCVSQSTVPQDHFYRLPSLSAPATAKGQIVQGSLGISEMKAEGLLRERPMLYVDPQWPLEIRQYHYRHWTKTPTQLIQDSMLFYFRDAGIAQQVIRFAPGRQAEVVLNGRLLRFERLLQGSSAAVTVEMEVEYKRYGSAEPQRKYKEYTNTVDAAGESIHDTVEAYGQALKNIYNEIIKDLAANPTTK
ncbi:ABC-type transport auxiliary lipoprotein family protein [Kaarinaea lacus]